MEEIELDQVEVNQVVVEVPRVVVVLEVYKMMMEVVEAGLDTYHHRMTFMTVFIILPFFYSGYGCGGMNDAMSFTFINDIDDLSYNFGSVALAPQSTDSSYDE